MQRELSISSRQRLEVLDITESVARIVAESEQEDGICQVYVPHATAAIVINESDDPHICLDLLDALDRMVPEGVWRHDRVDSNGAAHIKAAILGPSESIPFRERRLQLGIWQAIMLVDLDGPRHRRVLVTLR